MLCIAGAVVIVLSGCSGGDGEAASCEQLSERDQSTLVAVIAQADSFGVAFNEFLQSAVNRTAQRADWLAAGQDQLAVMRASVAEQRRLVGGMESDGLQHLFRPGLAAYGRAVSDLADFRLAVKAGDTDATRAAADRIDASQRASRRESEQFTNVLLRDFCNPPPLPKRPN